MKYRQIKFNKYIIKFIPSFNQLYIFNKINGLINYKLDINKLHMTLLYIKMNPIFLNKFLNITDLIVFCEKVLNKFTIYPVTANEVIKPLNDVFSIIYGSTFHFHNALTLIHNYIIKTITKKLDKINVPYTVKHKCEKDGGVWLYIDIIKNNTLTSILKMRIDPLLPHMSFSTPSLSHKQNPITVYDIRKIYRNYSLRKEISYSKLDFKNGIIEFS